MLPPASVLTNGICRVHGMMRSVGVLVEMLPHCSGAPRLRRFLLFAVVICMSLTACSPPGPRALLEGKKLIDEGRHAEAVPYLAKAAELLPKNALAWNYLGLAYQGSDQPESAAKAYRAALALDHKMAVVRYNLGCLYLEQNNLPAAIDEFKSYTLLQPGAVEGWLKQGTALLRARRLEEAEKSFRAALDLQAKHPEALNGLGLIQVQRRRWQEALNHFNVAALQDPPHAPAVLNSAIVQHQYLNNRSAALQRYRQYLALQPRPSDWETVEAAARQLDQELNPTPLAARSAGNPPSAHPKTNAVAQTAASARTTPSVPSSLQPVPARTNQIASTGPSRPSNATAAPLTNALAANRPSVETARTPPRPNVARGAELPAAKTPEVEVTQIQSDLVLKPAQELNRAPQPPAGELIQDNRTTVGANGSSNGVKRGFFSRLNPFGGKSRTGATAPAVENFTPPSRSVEAQATPPVSVPRYAHLAPAAPTPGNRAEAEKAFKRGLKAQKSGRRAEATAEYQAAVKADPASYDAYYNLGLVALENGDFRLSLWAYEIALALKPGADDARYNFALALKAGGYWIDSAEQLQKLLAENPSDARAHLSLANLYSQQLQQPQLAREHYVRVLDLNPKHAEAAKIRYWLAANP